jgi:DNA-binding LacI/PurR family transcriptional regulator
VIELGFLPNALGRSLRSRRYKAIGVVVPSYTNPVFANSLAGIEVVARASDRMLLTAATDYAPERELAIVKGLMAQHLEGLILTVADCDRSPALDLLDRSGVPYVLVHNQPDGPGRHAVAVDNFRATQEVTSALLAAGHRRFAYVSGRFRSSDRARRRYAGCVAALAEAGLAPPALIELDYLGSAQDHRQCLSDLGGAGVMPTALLCSNDLLALSVMAAARDVGLSVPHDVSVVGFDGIAIGHMVTPTLATVDTPTEAMGSVAMHRLLRLVSGEHVRPDIELLPHHVRAGGTWASVTREAASGHAAATNIRQRR